jgi:hypothetical protein
MLQAHSFLWHYLWIAPNVLLLFLAALKWQRFHRQFPIFLVFAALSAVAQLAVYAADVVPSVSPEVFWKVYWACLVIEALLKFALVAEIFARLFGPYPSIARTSRLLIRGVGVALALTASLVAGYAHSGGRFWIVEGAHLVQQTIFFIECGLIVFLFLLATYFKLTWDRVSFGIAVGLGISASVHLATWAVMANGGLLDKRYLLDFLNMATYHACVLIWFYYLLVPRKATTTSAVPLPEHNLEIWNRELERLLQP